LLITKQQRLMASAAEVISWPELVGISGIDFGAALYFLCLLGVTALPVRSALAYDNYQVGHISRVSFITNGIGIWLDTGLPTNCAGTIAGYMMVSSSSAPLMAFVTGLWMRGDASQVGLTVYTTPVDSTGFCQVTQIDTGNAGG